MKEKRKYSLNEKLAYIMCIILLAGAVCMTAISVLSSKNGEPTTDFGHNYAFFNENYEENIFEDENYLALNHSVLYKKGAVTISLDLSEKQEFDAPLIFLLDYIDVVKNGKYQQYDAFFSNLYFTEYSNPEKFTMQKIYDVSIENISEEKKETETNIYTEYVYSLEYKIMQNNGTFRNDIGSDSIRTQYFLITNREGDLLIDNIMSYQIYKEPAVSFSHEIIWLSVIVLAVLCAAFTMRTAALSFVPGAFSAMTVAFLEGAFATQFIVFSAISALVLFGIIVARKKKSRNGKKEEFVNLIDEIGIIIKAVDTVDGGKIKVKNKIYEAKAKDEPIKEGSLVKIVAVDGETLICTDVF